MTQDRLWAKKKPKKDVIDDSRLLLNHLRDVHEAARRVFAVTGREQLRALGLPTEQHDRFQRLLLFAAATHDLGKANSHFQEMITDQRDVSVNPQGLRHEWATILILEQLRDWLLPALGGSDSDWRIVQWAIAGHHPSLDHASPPRAAPDGSSPELTLLLGHADFAAILDWLASLFALPSPPTCHDQVIDLCGEDSVFTRQLDPWVRRELIYWKQIQYQADAKLAAGLKACLIAADVAGSALGQGRRDSAIRWDWIDRSLTHRPQPDDFQKIVKARLGSQPPRPFQLEVARSQASVTFVKAGCGTGKTIAAYMWAAENFPNRRLYFCYPTTGTTTEGFKDYLYDPDGELGDIGARLFHSRRDIDFELILTTGADMKNSPEDEWERRAALDTWSTPVVACTVDTVLGLMQNHRRGLFSWPALVQAAFVFDEIHSYDDKLFSALLGFLRDLPGLPVLLMTASLPESRLQRIRHILQRARRPLCEISGPQELEALPRYRQEDLSLESLPDLVHSELAQGSKVLWIANTVDRVINLADQFRCCAPLLYHSRFKYVDRVQRHRDAIAAFDRNRDPTGRLVICTQVAEMSLDLSADLLITELAPIPALIQRLGRLNRRARPGDPTKPFMVIPPPREEPYSKDELTCARRWLERLPKDNISQRDLANAWLEQTSDTTCLERCRWSEGGPVTEVYELRTPGVSFPFLMESDLGFIKKPKDVERYVISMLPPKKNDWYAWERFGSIPIAPEGVLHYDPMRGALWQN